MNEWKTNSDQLIVWEREYDGGGGGGISFCLLG